MNRTIPTEKLIQADERWTRTLDTYNRQVEQIRADRLTSNLGKSRQIAAAWLEAVEVQETIMKSLEGDPEVELQQLTDRYLKPVVRLGSDELQVRASFRDALQRATEAANDTAPRQPGMTENPNLTRMRDLLDTAHMTEDDLQIRAVLAVAVQRSMNALVEAHIGKRPEDGQDLKRLLTLRNGAGVTTEMLSLLLRYAPPGIPPEASSFGHTAEEVRRGLDRVEGQVAR